MNIGSGIVRKGCIRCLVVLLAVSLCFAAGCGGTAAPSAATGDVSSSAASEAEPDATADAEPATALDATKAARTETHYAMYDANKALSELTYLDAGYDALKDTYDATARAWYKGQHYMDLVTCGEITQEEEAQESLEKAAGYFSEAKSGTKSVLEGIAGTRGGAAEPGAKSAPESTAGTQSEPTEVEFDEGVPMPNVVRPVILLSGTDYEIGYQYYTQLVQINGKELPAYQYDVEAAFRRDKIHRDSYTEEELTALRKFEAAIAQYAPEWIDILHGMADGAKDSGLTITYDDLLLHYSLFERMSSWGPNTLTDDVFQNGEKEGNNVLGAKEASTCSGFAAWGNSTKDGKLVATGITDDSEGNFSATVMVFPETGNNFVTQTVNVVGFGGFPNHPNMNNKGLIRVHHAGSTFTENEETSHNAVPRGIADMHTMRFANNTEEAYDMFMAYSPGTENLGNGIFYADVGVTHDDAKNETKHALVVESRNPVSVRYPGDNGEGDFIYASNNWFCDIKERGGVKTPHGGYWNNDGWYWWSVSRNNLLYDFFSENQGEVDVDFMKMVCRYPSKVNEAKTLAEIDATYYDGNGSDYMASVGSLENSGIAIAVPDNGNNGTFYVSTGSVGRQTAPAYPNSHQYQPGKTGAFYQLKLAESPEAVATLAREEARRNMDTAAECLKTAALEETTAQPLNEILAKAQEKFVEGEQCLQEGAANGKDGIYDISKATRCFAASQAFANQVYEVLVPPETLE